jgi:hypothetical protein
MGGRGLRSLACAVGAALLLAGCAANSLADSAGPSVAVTTPSTEPAPTTPKATTPSPLPSYAKCDHKSYPTVCIPPYPPDLDCKDIPYKSFKVRRPDPHGFDADGNGIGCEQT